MSFTYMDGDTETRDYIRFTINDVTEGSGPLPNDANFSDEELDMMLAEEGTWQRTVAACYEALQSAWAKHTTFQSDGLSMSMSHVAARYEKLADAQRKKYGGTNTARARTMIRVDGYSHDVASDEIDDVSYT